MKSLKIAETEHTPQVILDADQGTFEMKGRLITLDSHAFFDSIFLWWQSYLNHPNEQTTLSFELEYISTANSKSLTALFKMLEVLPNVKVIWYYDEDEDQLDAGEDFSYFTKIPFEFVQAKQS
ncbi:MAG TPA: nuclear pore complex subunit [Microscillaceae bacterium]|nr:nuclear pore complex subunit [Microscillaceae bacterium]